MKYFILLAMTIASCGEEPIEECPCYADLQYPIYKGCEEGTVYDLNNGCSVEAIYKQIYKAIKYPPEAREDSIQGTVAVTFDIYEDGSLGNYAAPYDTLGYGLAEAAINAVKTLNERGYCPARENCAPVIFNYTLPIKFVLQ